MSVEAIATLPDGDVILRFTLQSNQLRARVLSFGAALQSLYLDGLSHSLVLGYDTPLSYLANPAYLGVIVGRVANRISGGQFSLDGRRYELDRNENGKTTLHGGRDGCSHRNWDVLDHGTSHVTLGLCLPDGHMGFPGKMDLTVSYRLYDTSLRVELSAQTDAPTVCNPAPHIYFNLDGRPNIDAHLLQLESDQVIPVENGIPQSGPVAASTQNLDITQPRRVPPGLDHHFCFFPHAGAPRLMATVSASGIAMEVRSTAPGLQIYDGSGLEVRGEGLNGTNYGPRAGLALEPHCWIDAPNQAWSHQAALKPGEIFHTQGEFCFQQTTPHQRIT